MDELTDPINAVLRIACAMAVTIAAAVFSLVFAVLCAAAAVGQGKNIGRGPIEFAVALTIYGALAFFSSYLSWRLWKGSLSSNGVTVMPTWFIQTFGAFFLAGILFAWWRNPFRPFLLEGAALALAMLFFHWQVAKRKRGNGDTPRESV